MPTVLDTLRALIPWMPDELLQIYADAWVETGDPAQALAEVRTSPSYDTYFPGNRRPDGSIRYPEETYLAIIDSYRATVLRAGVNPDFFANQFVDLIAGEVSPAEFEARVNAIVARVIARSTEVRQVYEDFGFPMTDAALIASIMDPNLGQAILERRLDVAELGAQAALRGFDVSSVDFGRLVDLGVTAAQGEQIFTEAADRLPTLDELARRHLDPDDTFDLAEFLKAAVEGSTIQRQRIRRLLSQEQSLFASTGQAAEGRRGLVGLEPA